MYKHFDDLFFIIYIKPKPYYIIARIIIRKSWDVLNLVLNKNDVLKC